MKLFEEINLLERLDQLIRLKATGTPSDLAKRLELSEREVYRIISELRAKDIKIAYCRQKRSYYYENETFLKFQACVIENGKERRLLGGENIFDFLKIFFTLPKSGSVNVQLCNKLKNTEEQNDAGGFCFSGLGY